MDGRARALLVGRIRAVSEVHQRFDRAKRRAEHGVYGMGVSTTLLLWGVHRLTAETLAAGLVFFIGLRLFLLASLDRLYAKEFKAVEAKWPRSS